MPPPQQQPSTATVVTTADIEVGTVFEVSYQNKRLAYRITAKETLPDGRFSYTAEPV